MIIFIFKLLTFVKLLKNNINIFLSGPSINKLDFSKYDNSINITVNNLALSNVLNERTLYIAICHYESLVFLLNELNDLSKKKKIILFTIKSSYSSIKLLLNKEIIVFFLDSAENKITKKLNKHFLKKKIVPNTLLVLLEYFKFFRNHIYIYGCDGIETPNENNKNVYNKIIDSYKNLALFKNNIYFDTLTLNKYINPSMYPNAINCNSDSKVKCFNFKYDCL